jgi:hypothetical protein
MFAVLVPDASSFPLFAWDAEVEDVLGRQRVPHPDVLAVFERLVLVACRRDPLRSASSGRIRSEWALGRVAPPLLKP